MNPMRITSYICAIMSFGATVYLLREYPGWLPAQAFVGFFITMGLLLILIANIPKLLGESK